MSDWQAKAKAKKYSETFEEFEARMNKIWTEWLSGFPHKPDTVKPEDGIACNWWVCERISYLKQLVATGRWGVHKITLHANGKPFNDFRLYKKTK